MSLRIKRDDNVTVISGRDKGAQGRVLAVFPKKGTAIVEHINIIKKHERAQGQDKPGGIIEKEAPIPLNKLMLTETGGKGRAGRFATRKDDKGNKIRVLKIKGEGKDVVV